MQIIYFNALTDPTNVFVCKIHLDRKKERKKERKKKKKERKKKERNKLFINTTLHCYLQMSC